MAFVTITCWRCKVQYGMTEEFYRVAKQGAGNISFFCPNGHSASFALGKTDEDKMREERDRAIQRVAEYQDYYQEARERAEKAERRVSAAKGQVTKLKKRAAAGVCPCCNRTFSDLSRHMAGKHPGFVSEPTADEHVH